MYLSFVYVSSVTCIYIKEKSGGEFESSASGMFFHPTNKIFFFKITITTWFINWKELIMQDNYFNVPVIKLNRTKPVLRPFAIRGMTRAPFKVDQPL